MPMKTCPECGEQHGPRKKVCDCGHDFQVKSRKDKTNYPEPGAWVDDKTSGMPELEIPDEVTDKLTVKELRDYHVAYEGLGFCIYSLIPAKNIKDEKLRSLWRKARKTMQEIVDYMEKA